MSTSQTLVIGLGEVGRPLLNILQQIDPTVVGVDIEPQSFDNPIDTLHVCFPFEISTGFVSATVAYAKQYSPEMIVLHSTVSPGTTKEVEAVVDCPVVYSPIRGKHNEMESELRHYRKFIASRDEEAAKKVQAQFEKADIPTQIIASPEGLELAKLLETTYFGMLIGWAQEMNRFCEKMGASYEDMSLFFEEIGYLPPKVFVPGHIGGHCVIPNAQILQSQFGSKFLEALIDSNDRRAEELEVDIQTVEAKDRVRLEPRTHQTNS